MLSILYKLFDIKSNKKDNDTRSDSAMSNHLTQTSSSPCLSLSRWRQLPCRL